MNKESKYLLCKERGIVRVVEVNRENSISSLALRARENADLDYYVFTFKDDPGISAEAMVETFKRFPNLLDKSDMVERLT